MKKFKVEMFSKNLDVEMKCETKKEAFLIYSQLRKNQAYEKGHIVSTETGEVFAHFTCELDDYYEIITREWVAF